MPKGKKVCPECSKEHGARKRKCECGYEFGSKQERNTKPVKQTNHPLGQEYVPNTGLWVFDVPKGMPKIHVPEPLPTGPIDNQTVYDACAYNGIGDCIAEQIPSRRIADPKLRKLWKKAKEAQEKVWEYLTNGQ